MTVVGCPFLLLQQDAWEAAFLRVYNLISRVKVQFKSDKTAGVWFVLRGVGEVKIAMLRDCFHSKLSSIAKLGIRLQSTFIIGKKILLSASHSCVLFRVGVHLYIRR